MRSSFMSYTIVLVYFAITVLVFFFVSFHVVGLRGQLVRLALFDRHGLAWHGMARRCHGIPM